MPLRALNQRHCLLSANATWPNCTNGFHQPAELYDYVFEDQIGLRTTVVLILSITLPPPAESYDYVFEDQIEFIVDQYLAGSGPVSKSIAMNI